MNPKTTTEIMIVKRLLGSIGSALMEGGENADDQLAGEAISHLLIIIERATNPNTPIGLVENAMGSLVLWLERERERQPAE